MENLKDNLKRLIRQKKFLIGIIVFFVVVIFFVVLNIFNSDKINTGLKAGGIKLGGANIVSAEERLKFINEEFVERKIFLNYKNQKWETSPKEMGLSIDDKETALLAFNYSHSGKSPIIASWRQLKSLLGKDVSVVWNIDEEKMEKFLGENLNSIHQPAQNATLVFNPQKEGFSSVPEKNGIVISIEQMKKSLEEIVSDPNKNEVWLHLTEQEPEIDESETLKALEKTKEIMQTIPISINTYEGDEKEKSKKEIDKIETENLLNLIDFEPISDPENPENKILGVTINEEAAKNYLISLAPQINREPIDAKLTFKNGRVIVFALSQSGIRLEIEKNIPILFRGILNNQKIILEIKQIKPLITTESIDNLGIISFLGKGVSNFSGSPTSRVHNIKIATARFNGVLIEPEKEFSFNEILGEVGPEQGYEPELVIKKNKTIPEYGGGICQVSTTVFRAAVNSGLKVTERFAHAFPVKYYNPQGFDATIYPPSPDLKFINNTPANILLQAKIVGTELIFEIYGTDDSRKIKIDGPKQYDIKEDGSMKATLTQEVYDKDGNPMFKKTFYSNYKSPDLYPVERNPLE